MSALWSKLKSIPFWWTVVPLFFLAAVSVWRWVRPRHPSNAPPPAGTLSSEDGEDAREEINEAADKEMGAVGKEYQEVRDEIEDKWS